MSRPSLDDFFSRSHHAPAGPIIKPRLNGFTHTSTATTKEKDTSNADNETLSTFNCDDSYSVASFHSSHHKLPPAPVTTVIVDTTTISGTTTGHSTTAARQRLRDQEQKISALIRNDHSLLTIVKTLETDLKKTEAEKEQLEDALEEWRRQRLLEQHHLLQQLQQNEAEEDTSEEVEEVTDDNASEDDDDDQESSTALLHRVFLEQREAWQYAQVALQQKTDHMTQLQSRLDAALKQIAGLQVDLETHDVHFTSFAKQNIAEGKAAMKELKSMTAKDKSLEIRELGHRAKKMVRTLLQDLESLDQRYKDAKFAHLKHVTEWGEEREFLQRRVRQLQQLGRQQNRHSSLSPASYRSMGSHGSNNILPVIAEEDGTLLEHTQTELANCQAQLEQQQERLQGMQKEAVMHKDQVQQLRQEKRTMDSNMEGLHQRIYALEANCQQQKLLLQVQASTDHNQRHQGFLGKLAKKMKSKSKQNNSNRKDGFTMTDEEKLRLLYVRMDKQDARLEELLARNEMQARQNAQLKQQLMSRAQQDGEETASSQQQLQQQRVSRLQTQVRQLLAQLARQAQERDEERARFQAKLEELQARLDAQQPVERHQMERS